MRFFCTLPVHGQRNNTDIGLYFYGARWYDSSLGRFTQADTVLPGGQGVQAWDRYAYANNNPARYNDPSGHCLEDLCIGEAILLALVVEEVAPEIEAEVPIVEQEVTTFVEEAEPAVQEAITEGEQTATKVINNIGKQCSFTADTKVATKDGKKNIGDIKTGDKILAWNESDNTTDYHNVTAVLVHEDKTLTEVIINGEWIETTPKHPFYTEEKGWLPAGDLEMGMHVRQADGNYELVWLKWNVHKTQEMYNLTVDTAHTFFVGEGQLLVHNSCEPYEVGLTNDLYGKSTVDNGLDIHHAPQKVPASQVIPGYDPNRAPGIA